MVCNVNERALDHARDHAWTDEGLHTWHRTVCNTRRMSKRMSKHVSKHMSKHMSDQTSEHMSEHMSKHTGWLQAMVCNAKHEQALEHALDRAWPDAPHLPDMPCDDGSDAALGIADAQPVSMGGLLEGIADVHLVSIFQHAPSCLGLLSQACRGRRLGPPHFSYHKAFQIIRRRAPAAFVAPHFSYGTGPRLDIRAGLPRLPPGVAIGRG